MRGRDESATAPTGPTAPTALRRSPVAFDANPAATEMRDAWRVVLRYQDEEQHGGPRLVDLSHRRRWDYQDGSLATQRPMNLPVPPGYGQVACARSTRYRTHEPNPGLDLAPGCGDAPPDHAVEETAFTETTDGHCMLAFAGAGRPRTYWNT